MTTPKQTGAALISGVVKAEDQHAELHRVPRTDGIPLTPAQHRKLMSDDWPGEPPEGYSSGTVVVSDGRPRPRTNAAEPDAAWDRIDAAKAGEASPAAPVKKASEEAEKIREYARADVSRAKARVAAAMANAGGEERKRAADDARATLAFAQRVKDKIGL